MNLLEQAIKQAGGASEFARSIEITTQLVGLWRKEYRVPSTALCFVIEDLHGIPFGYWKETALALRRAKRRKIKRERKKLNSHQVSA